MADGVWQKKRDRRAGGGRAKVKGKRAKVSEHCGGEGSEAGKVKGNFPGDWADPRARPGRAAIWLS